MYYIYIIRCHDNSLYTGITNDIKKRMKEHYYKTKEGAKYTRARNITSLEVLWTAENRSEASKLEYYLKRLTKIKKEELIKHPSLLDDERYTLQPNITLKQCLEKNDD